MNAQQAAAPQTQELEALRERVRELERSNADLAQFASIASHDLQEPLRKIIGFSDILRSRLAQADPDTADLAGRAARSAERASTLVDDLLALARVTAQLRPLEDVALDGVVDDVLTDLERAVASARARVERRPLPRLRADAAQMRQLFLNLIGNALKYRCEERPLVVGLHSRPARRGFVDVVVEDNGLGVPDGQQHLLFQPFQRLHARGLREGTGLGLAICRKIALRHGGFIAFEAGAAAGARFIVTLPTLYGRKEAL
jgi:two-component system sensor kinase FixL